jgi:hypothetical protein
MIRLQKSWVADWMVLYENVNLDVSEVQFVFVHTIKKHIGFSFISMNSQA